MNSSNVVSQQKPPTSPFSMPAQPVQEWGRLMQETAASTPVPEANSDLASLNVQVADLEGEVQGLQREIHRMMNAYRALAQQTGEMESHQQNQISMLMMLIASLSKKVHLSDRTDALEVQQIHSLMNEVQLQLATERFHEDSDSATASIALGQMRALQSNLERALAQILQQLSALHMRMGSLV